MSGGGPMAVYLYLLGRHADALRVATGAGELVLPRTHRLPLRALREAAHAGGYLAVCPWVEGADGRALVALWTYAQDHERALAALPTDLAPQAIVHAPVGATLLWILPTPYPEAPADGRPAPAAVLGELAEALGTIPASPADMLPVPAGDADLVILDRDGATDAEALWAWAHAAADTAREQTWRAAAERVAMAARVGEGDVANMAGKTEVPSAETATDGVAPASPGVVLAGPGAETDVCDTAGTHAGPAPADSSVLQLYIADERSETAVHAPSPAGGDQPGARPAAEDETRAAKMTALSAGSAGMDEMADHIAAERGADEIAADGTVEELRVSPDGTLTPPRELVSGLVDTSSAADREPQPGIDPTIEEGLPGRVVLGSSGAAISGLIADGFADLPDPLRSLLVAAAQAERLSNRDALAEAVVAYALAALGTREVYHRLGLQLTWKRPDGFYGLTPDREWRKLTELSSKRPNS